MRRVRLPLCAVAGGGGATAHAGAGVLSGRDGRDREPMDGQPGQRDERGRGAGITLGGRIGRE